MVSSLFKLWVSIISSVCSTITKNVTITNNKYTKEEGDLIYKNLHKIETKKNPK
jgi:hypothetical protein